MSERLRNAAIAAILMVLSFGLSAGRLATAASTSATATSASAGDIGRYVLLMEHERLRAVGSSAGALDPTRLPLGDSMVARSPGQGMLFVCNPFPLEAAIPGEPALPWIHGQTFDLTAKIAVSGSVSWADAVFTAASDGDVRTLAGNMLPINHTTGIFPVAASDPAIRYRPSRSVIRARDYQFVLPANPAPAASASCVGGEVGIALSGVPIYSALDAQLRDAVAQEVQDSCAGHPNDIGYHYHSISACFADTSDGHSALMGYAFDGFGIYGHRGENGETLTDADLDECHGHTHAVLWDGQMVEMYHYHATWEFPYTIGCYRGTSVLQGPAFGPPQGSPGGR